MLSLVFMVSSEWAVVAGLHAAQAPGTKAAEGADALLDGGDQVIQHHSHRSKKALMTARTGPCLQLTR
jgi:hypothetical protein